MSKMIYWAGDRGFRACTRWHDEQAIKILREGYCWEVYYPFDENITRGEQLPEFFGKRGLLRHKCLMGIERSSLVVAYLGTHDTGTAQELEYALVRKKPILAWSDSAVITGEYSGRDIALSQTDMEDLEVRVFPMNGMTAIFDRYVEFSTLGKRISPQDLADIINREANIVLK